MANAAHHPALDAAPARVECRACNDTGRVTHRGSGCDVEEYPATDDDHPANVYICRSCDAGEPSFELDRLVDEARDAIIANDDIRALKATDELRALAHRIRGAL